MPTFYLMTNTVVKLKGSIHSNIQWCSHVFRISLHKLVFEDDNHGKYVALAHVGVAYCSRYFTGPSSDLQL